MEGRVNSVSAADASSQMDWEVGGPFPMISVIRCTYPGSFEEPPSYEPVAVLGTPANPADRAAMLLDAHLMANAARLRDALTRMLADAREFARLTGRPAHLPESHCSACRPGDYDNRYSYRCAYHNAVETLRILREGPKQR
jgi:hypothetical protein